MKKIEKLSQDIESLLFISAKPMSVKKLAELTNSDKSEVREAFESLTSVYEARKTKGIELKKIGDSYQMSTASNARTTVEKFIKDEITGELTKPSIETLTIIAYRGPVSKFELEQIRGVNCSLILRNLMMRGLVQSEEDKKKKQVYYQITFDFLRYLGITKQDELPDYERLNSNEILDQYLLADIPEV